MDEFSAVFKTTKSNVKPQALAYASGLFQTTKSNIEKISEQVPNFEYYQLQHFISNSPWDDSVVDKTILQRASSCFGGRGSVGLIFDPTGIPKKGQASVGVARQWIGPQGKVDNGQVAVVAALVNGRDACLVDKELYLPKSWVEDADRCQAAGVPLDRIHYRSHQQMVEDMIQRIDEQGISYDWIGMDGEFGIPWLLHHLDDSGKQFLVDIKKSQKVYPHSPKIRTRTRENRGKLKRLSYKAKSVALKDLVDRRRWKRVRVRWTTKGILEVDIQSRVVWLKDQEGKARPFHLIIRKDRGKKQPDLKFSLSNASLDTSLEELAFMQAQRFWIEHAIKECKQQAGTGDYQVRSWQAWHHHFTMTMLVGLFLVEMRLEYNDKLPLLTAGDIWTLLFGLLPRKTDTRQGLLSMIEARYRKRELGISYHYLRE